MSPVEFAYWAEGPTDRAVARKLIKLIGAVPGPDYSGRRRASPGRDYLDANVARFNAAAQQSPWLVLRDADGACAVELIARLLPKPSKLMSFRIVVPAIEAWLLADHDAMAKFLGVSAARIPPKPEEINDVKRFVVELARHSRLRAVREDFLPVERSGRVEGPGYAVGLIEFINTIWDPHRASTQSSSLRKTISRLELVANE